MLATRGWAVASITEPGAFDRLVDALGEVVGEEAIRLREGAHAYVAKPGRVPLHTDHPRVDTIVWRCMAQDRVDGASWLLDTRPVLRAMPPALRDALAATNLECPPLAGGAPSLRHPVLWGDGELFCSPWLRAAPGETSAQSALDALRDRLSEAAAAHRVDVRLGEGDVLVVDNHRVLHGRGPLATDSPRHLHRVWIQSRVVTARPALRRIESPR